MNFLQITYTENTLDSIFISLCPANVNKTISSAGEKKACQWKHSLLLIISPAKVKNCHQIPSKMRFVNILQDLCGLIQFTTNYLGCEKKAILLIQIKILIFSDL